MLDHIIKQVGSKFGLGDKSGDVVEAILKQIQGQGGLDAILKQFQGMGLTEKAESWVGKGENIPATPAETKSALGESAINDIAEKFGVDPEAVSGAAAEVIPNVVDKATPEGKLPEGPDLMGMLEGMIGKGGLGNLGGMLGGLLDGDKK